MSDYNEVNIVLALTGLDLSLKELAKCDSSMQYAPHMREPFDKMIRSLNNLRKCLNSTMVDNRWYFDECEDEED